MSTIAKDYMVPFRLLAPHPAPTRKLWEIRASFTALHEVHTKACTCSYCKGAMKLGLNLPECKARNSWRVIHWKWNGNNHYLRWTLPRKKEAKL